MVNPFNTKLSGNIYIYIIHGRQGSTCITWPMPWLLMTWRQKEPEQQQPHYCDIDLGSWEKSEHNTPDSKVHVANMGPTWVLPAPDGPHVGPMNIVIRDSMDNTCSDGKLDLSPISLMFIQSQIIFNGNYMSLLSHHWQWNHKNFLALSQLQFGQEQNEIIIKFELWWLDEIVSEMVSWLMIPWRLSYMSTFMNYECAWQDWIAALITGTHKFNNIVNTWRHQQPIQTL